MKITSTIKTIQGRRHVHFVAVIPKSLKLGIPRRYQKTFRVQCETARLEDAERSVNHAALRWEKKVLEGIKMADAIFKDKFHETQGQYELATEPPKL